LAKSQPFATADGLRAADGLLGERDTHEAGHHAPAFATGLIRWV
jgi:hypothetical protein